MRKSIAAIALLLSLFNADTFLYRAAAQQNPKPRFVRQSGQCPLARPTNRGIHMFGKVAAVSKDTDGRTWLDVNVAPSNRSIRLDLGESPRIKDGISPVRGSEAVPIVQDTTTLLGKPLAFRADNINVEGLPSSSFTARVAWISEGIESELRSAQEAISFLSRNEDPSLSEAFVAELAFCAKQVQSARKLYPEDLARNPHILIGRIEVPEGTAPQSVSGQTELLDKGYLVTTCLAGVAIGYSLHGFLPLEITAKSTEGVVENFGTVRFSPVPREQLANVKFRLPAKFADIPLTDIYLTTRCGSVGAASHSSVIYPSLPTRIDIANNGKGEFSATNFSPGIRYDLTVDLRSEHYYCRFTISPGEFLDLGLVPIK